MQQFIEFSVRHWELWSAFIIVLILLIVFELRNKLTGLPQLSPQQATLLVNREDAVVIDVRDSNSFQQGHIINAINIPLAELANKVDKLKSYKTNPLIIISATGQTPQQVSKLLQNQDFSKIYYLKNGIAAWQNAGLPLVKN